jgi:hypothetical protein
VRTEKQKVEVEIYGVVRDLIKEPNVEVELSGRQSATFNDVLEGLADRYGLAFRDRVFDREGRLLSHVKVYAGGKPVGDLDQPLPIGDDPVVRIVVMAAAGGG